jgi:hypothetical protein
MRDDPRSAGQLMVVTLLVTCAIGVASAHAADSGGPVIRLQKFPSCKNCESYEVSVERGGSVAYIGKQTVKTSGTVHYKIEARVVDKLLAAFEKADFESVPEGKLLGEEGSDIPVAEISLLTDGRTKSVRFKMGKNPHIEHIEKLTQLAAIIQEAVQIRKLICPAQVRTYGCM